MKERCPELRSLVGVFDGHKRAEPAKTAAKRLPELLARSGLCRLSCASLRGYLVPLRIHDGGDLQRNEVRKPHRRFLSSHKSAKPPETCQSPWPGTGLHHQRMNSKTGHAVTVLLGGRPAGACSQNTSAADGCPCLEQKRAPQAHTISCLRLLSYINLVGGSVCVP